MIELTHILNLPLVQCLREADSLDQIRSLLELDWREVSVAEGDPGWAATLTDDTGLAGWTIHLAKPAMLEAHRHGWAAGLPYGEREVVLRGAMMDLNPQNRMVRWKPGTEILHPVDSIHQPVVEEDAILLVHQPAGLRDLLHSCR